MPLALDASTPAVATSATTTVTTASFTPPAGAVLVAIVLHGTSNAGAARDSSISASTGLTWTSRISTPLTSPEANGGLARVYTAVVATSAATTVTSTITVNSWPGSMLAVLVYTGADTAAPLEGAVWAQPTGSTISQVITTITDGCQPWLGNTDWAGQAAPTPDTGTTTYAAAAPGGSDQFLIARRAVISPAGTGYIGSTAPNSGTRNAWIAFAVKPSIGGPAVHDATAVLAASGGLSATGARTTAATATLAASAVLTAAAIRTRTATATLGASSGLSATAARVQAATATMAAVGGLAGSGLRTQAATAALAASGALTAEPVRSTDGTATLTAGGTLGASGTGTTTTSAALAATGTLTATAEIPGQVSHLFTTQTPTLTDQSDGAPGITVGTTIRSAVDGYAQGVRWYTTTTVSGTYVGAIWQVTAADDPAPAGTLLAQKTLAGSPVSGGWQSITFDDAVPIVAGILYRVAVFSGDGRYVYAAGIHTADLVTGDLTADANGDDPAGLGSLRQAVFAIGPALAYPSTVAGSSGTYFADIDFVAGDAPVDGTAALAAVGGLTAAAERVTSGSAVLAGTSTLTAAGERAQTATSSLTGVGALTGSATTIRAGTAALTASAGLTAAATPVRAASSTLAATGALAASGDVITPGINTATLTATGGLTATATRSTASTALLTAAAGLGAAGTRAQGASTTLTGQAALTADPVLEQATTAALAGASTLTADGTVNKHHDGTLNGDGGLTATGNVTLSATAVLAAVGGLTAASGTTQTATAVFAATGGLTAATTYRRRPGRLIIARIRARLTPGGHR